MNSQARNVRIDTLRMVSMMFIITLHILNQGGLLGGVDQHSGKYYYLSFLNIACYGAVNIYGLITGYVLCNKPFKISRLLNLWLTTIFWSCVISCVYLCLAGRQDSLISVILSFMPLVGGNYWFFTAYVILFLCSPILNHLLSAFSEKKIRLAILVALLLFGIVPIISLGNNSMQISNGYGFPWLIILYIIGGYVRLHGHAISDKIHGNLFLLGYLLFALLHVLYRISVEFITLRFLGNARFGNLFLFYNSPLIVGESVCLFLYAIRQVNTCGNRRLCSVIEYFTPGVFSVYIIHTHPLIWKHVLHNLFSGFANAGVVSISLLILLVSLSVFLVCAMLDVMRIKIFRLLCVDGFIKNVSHNIEVRIAHYFYS